MNNNMTGFRWFQKTLHPCALDERSLSIGRVKTSYANISYIMFSNPVHGIEKVKGKPLRIPN